MSTNPSSSALSTLESADEPDSPLPPVSLIPLQPGVHDEALQRVYELTPSYWDRYGLLSAPDGQGSRDLRDMAQDSSRYGLGILLPNQPGNPAAGAQLVGLIDFRLHWPERGVAYVGLIMVAEPFQRRGIAKASWRLLEEWLGQQAGINRVRLGVEQFTPESVKFLEALGFHLTGDSQRIRSGRRLVRLLAMEKPLREISQPQARANAA
jgi:RimJ/RimL family protein N-acetyltransferase